MTGRRIGIAGTGLIGASIGLRAREGGCTVVGYDSREEAAREALRRGAIDETGTFARVCACDVVVLAAPVAAVLEMLAAPELRASQARLVIDVASVKAPISEAATGLPHFVATHPMAGRERSGPEAADATLFAGKSWAYVASGDPKLDAAAEAFIREMGSTPRAVDAVAHDRIVARTSHLPQLFAWLLARRFVVDDVLDTDALSGPVARELLRIARSDRALWREIFAANAQNLAEESRLLAAALISAAEDLERGDAPV